MAANILRGFDCTTTTTEIFFLFPNRRPWYNFAFVPPFSQFNLPPFVLKPDQAYEKEINPMHFSSLAFASRN